MKTNETFIASNARAFKLEGLDEEANSSYQ